MKQILNFINEYFVTPLLKFLAPLAFLSLFYVGYSFFTKKYTNDVVVGSFDSGGWKTLRPGYIERGELPKDYTKESYERRVVYYESHPIIQIRKK